MHWLMNLSELPRTILIGMTLFVLGGLVSFGYSYRPLHGSLTWRVSDLQERLDDRNRENLVLQDELTKLRSIQTRSIDPETLEQVERELTKTSQALAKVEKKLDRSERRRKDADKASTRWKKRYEELRDTEAAVPTAPASADAQAGQGSSASPNANDPATPTGSNGTASPDARSAAASPGTAQAPASPADPEAGMLSPQDEGAPDPN